MNFKFNLKCTFIFVLTFCVGGFVGGYIGDKHGTYSTALIYTATAASVDLTVFKMLNKGKSNEAIKYLDSDIDARSMELDAYRCSIYLQTLLDRDDTKGALNILKLLQQRSTKK